MTVKYECLHEEQLQGQSRKLAELEVRADYKDEKIAELNNKIEMMDKKIDKVLDGFVELKQQSYHDDKDLEARLIRIETEQRTIKEQSKTNYNKLSTIMAVISVLFVMLTFYFNYIH